MTDENKQSGAGGLSDDMSNYLRIFIEETEEELENLVNALLKLEDEPENSEAINESFRLLHSLKGSSGMMGYMGISELAHQLENRFELFRSGENRLDRDTITFMLECVDFLNVFITDLRDNNPANEDSAYLIEKLKQLDTISSADNQPGKHTENSPDDVTDKNASQQDRYQLEEGEYLVKVTFEKNLQLADMKARLIVARLSNIGEIVSSDPPVDSIQSFEDLPQFVVVLKTDHAQQEVEEITNVDGVESIKLESGTPGRTPPAEEPTFELESENTIELTTQQLSFSEEDGIDDEEMFLDEAPATNEIKTELDLPVEEATPVPPKPSSRQKASETVRVDIERLDRLMNLTGELVMTKALFSQITSQMLPLFKASSSLHAMQELSEQLESGLEKLDRFTPESEEPQQELVGLRDQLESTLAGLKDQSGIWELGKKYYAEIANAVDQLNRVSDSLQQVVLQTRMVPVEPLFSRFTRVIRDLSLERNKQVRYVMKGEKTELDKRMIDELGDPLLHLIRNSLDHGLEQPEKRRELGKPETGTITMEATQSGNNVFINVQDDGSGINLENIKRRVLEKSLASPVELEGMSDQQITDFIWHPGFSTANEITDISGRGVGMDIVKNRIGELNGTVEVKSVPDVGTTFTIRLPLTLAIIRCLLVRIRDGLYSIPIDKVREIVSVPEEEVYAVQRHYKTINVRDEFVPLVSLDSLFDWNDSSREEGQQESWEDSKAGSGSRNVVILQSTGKTLGLCVEELVGRDDIVLKSLSDNYVSIRGLSGASVMGDGTVCLMLDTGEIMEMSLEQKI